MRKKGVYLTFSSFSESEGVEKKIKAQIKVLDKLFSVERINIGKERKLTFKKLISPLPGGAVQRDYKYAVDKIRAAGNLDFIYIRKVSLDKASCNFLWQLRKMYPNAVILLEIPTYPYDNELIQSKTMWPWYFKDKVWRRQLSKCIDRIVTYSDDSSIFNIPAIRIKNGYDVNEVTDYLRENNTAFCDIINILAVAQFQITHGYERVINGLANYYQGGGECKIHLHMIGDGVARPYYESLVKELGLQEYVTFYGTKTGAELKELYSLADISLGCFGAYHGGPQVSSALKTREYLAYGIPFVSGMEEDAFSDEKCDFYLEMPNDSSNIDMNCIVDFYQKLYGKYSRNELRRLIHEYAKRNVEISHTMKPVCDFILK